MIKPFIKWPGGKTEELSIITDNLPQSMNSYYEPFVGGGAVFLSIEESNHYYINDKSDELMSIYRYIKNGNNLFFAAVSSIDECWRKLEAVSDASSSDFFTLYRRYRDEEVTDYEMIGNVSRLVKEQSSEINEVLSKNLTCSDNSSLPQCQTMLGVCKCS